MKIIELIADLLSMWSPVATIVQTIHACGGRALLVGGAVRDLLLCLPVKDLDIEVHGITFNKLEEILAQYGSVNYVGKSFGVLRLHNLDIDWSLPRTDSVGRKPEVAINPFMSIKDAFARRDLTINAMGIDLISGELIDPFNGLHDLKNHLLRAPDKAKFVEDPLRFFRVMQFVGRFAMQPDAQLHEICATMPINTVSRERIEIEFNKLFLKSKQPSLGLRWLQKINRLVEVLPEVAATKNLQQDAQWHPEGDVFEHTMQAVDAAALLDYKNEEEKLIIMYAALCHDIGKVTKTQHVNGRIKNIGHAQESALLCKKLLKRITNNNALMDAVTKLVQYHMEPFQFVHNKASAAAYKRLAYKLSPEVNMAMLGKLALADKQGRNACSHEPLKEIPEQLQKFLARAAQLEVLYHKEGPILQGKDLLDVVQPGPHMGMLLKKAYQLQIEHDIKDKDELKSLVIRAN